MTTAFWPPAIKLFGVPVTVAINQFVLDTDAEIAAIQSFCAELDVKAFGCNQQGR